MRFLKYLLGITLLLNEFSALAQYTLPYETGFDQIITDTNWKASTVSGSGTWELGTPSPTVLNVSKLKSPPNAWCVNRVGADIGSHTMFLESPAFDFSDTSKSFMVRFWYAIRAHSGDGAFFQYSLDTGNSWHSLNGSSHQKYKWYNSNSLWGSGNRAGWSFGSNGVAHHSLDTLKGNSHVKFRFEWNGSLDTYHGLMIDDFGIVEIGENLSSSPVSPIVRGSSCNSFDLSLEVWYSNLSFTPFQHKTSFYFSADSILDSGDSLIYQDLRISHNPKINLNFIVPFPKGKPLGTHYIFYKLDADSVITETKEEDNVGYFQLILDTILAIPYISSFESDSLEWTSLGTKKWKREQSTSFGFKGAHFGKEVWSVPGSSTVSIDYLQSPNLNLSSHDSVIISFWYKCLGVINLANDRPIKYELGCSGVKGNIGFIPPMRNNTWDYLNLTLPKIADTSDFVKINIHNGLSTSIGWWANPSKLLVIDDIYIGPRKADLILPENSLGFSINSNTIIDTIRYDIVNCGLKPADSSLTTFYWSTDSIFDSNDILLGTKVEAPMDTAQKKTGVFTFTKPTIASGKYFILYFLDGNDSIDEMREYNNSGYFPIEIKTVFSIPYFNDFNNNSIGWSSNASLGVDNWHRSFPLGISSDSALIDGQAWISFDTANFYNHSRTHLLTPSFDLSSAINPVIEFDMRLRSGQLNMSYSIDNGYTWIVLDTGSSKSFSRWYYPMAYSSGSGADYIYAANKTSLLFLSQEKSFAVLNQYNGRDAKRNDYYNLDIKNLAGQPNVRFRFNIGVPQGSNSIERATIDNFNITEKNIDLHIPFEKSLIISSKAVNLRFYTTIENQGNYISNPSSLELYLSTDTILSANDYLIGNKNIPKIRPGIGYHLNTSFSNITNIALYKYLIFKVDAQNSVLESNESNNIRAWPLDKDGIKTLPYSNDFSDTILDGWHYYTKNVPSNYNTDFRIRNFIAKGEPTYNRDLQNSQLYTDAFTSWSGPYATMFYLVLPTFDFSHYDRIQMSFDLMSTGAYSGPNSNGGNLEYSLNGQTWYLLKKTDGKNYNWYNGLALKSLNNEPGWGKSPVNFTTAKLDSTSFDISKFSGENSVRFRFKYSSKFTPYNSGGPHGFRLDNFLVQGQQLDYVSRNNYSIIHLTYTNPIFPFEYMIRNDGPSDGRISSTGFYWSTDSFLDPTDKLIHLETDSALFSNDSIQKTINLSFPNQLNNLEYYVLYKADDGGEFTETNEHNNVGFQKVRFAPFPNFTVDDNQGLDSLLTTDTKYTIHFEVKNNGFVKNPPSKVTLYLSRESILRQGAIALDSIPIDSLGIGKTFSDSLEIKIPASFVHLQGHFFILYFVDSDDLLLEGNEEDNIGVFKIVLKDYYIGIIEQFSNPKISIFPNSFSDFVTININDQHSGIVARISDANGKVLKMVEAANQRSISIDLNFLAKGVYYLEIFVDGKTIRYKVIKS